MKNSILKIAVCLFAMLLFANCSKDNNSGEESGVTSNTFLTAKINGVDVSVNENVVAVFLEDIGIDDEIVRYYTVTASNLNDNGAGFNFQLKFPNNEGTHLATDYITTLYYAESTGGADISAWSAHMLSDTSGTITITEINDDYIEGSFSFIGKPGTVNDVPIEVIKGKFKALQ